MITAIALLLAAATPQEVPVVQGAAVDEAAACARMTRAAEQEKPNLPMMVDPVTRLDEIQYDCAARPI